MSKIPGITTSYYAQQSRARHIHQEKKLNKIIFNQNNKNLPSAKKATYSSFIIDALKGCTKTLKKLFKLI